MSIYVCSDCQQVFTEDEAGTYTTVEYLDGFAGDHWRHEEHWTCCPHCGSDDYEDYGDEEDDDDEDNEYVPIKRDLVRS